MHSYITASIRPLGLAVAFIFCACSGHTTPQPAQGPAAFNTPKTLSYTLRQQAAHPTQAFTQGWQLVDDTFIESSGLYGKSYLRAYDRQNKPLLTYKIPSAWFAEGVTQWRNSLFVLTWQAGKALELDATHWRLRRTHNYTGEGWGLTHNEQSLIMSDGSAYLQFRNPNTFALKHTLKVHGGQREWNNLNELEYAQGLIWANLWQEPLVIAINPTTGQVLGTLDLSTLVAANTKNPSHESLNGIAYDAKLDAFWVTGKLWANRYLIDIQPTLAVNAH